MSETQTIRCLASKTEIECSPFPSDSGYQPVLGADKLPVAYSGGMGVVFQAIQVDLGRHVAIKRMNVNSLQEAAARERFVLEAMTHAQLKHDNIVTLYAANLAKDDKFGPWLVLEWVDGQSLQELYDEKTGRRPTEEDAVNWVLQIADALIYVHDQKLIHRDVKPANILLRTSDRRPLLTDFGIVAARQLSPVGPRMTMTGMGMGTPDFMAPEQKRDASRVTPSADQWSLGATLAWLITGKVMQELGLGRDLPVNLRDLVFQGDRAKATGSFRGSARVPGCAEKCGLRPRPATPRNFIPASCAAAGSNVSNRRTRNASRSHRSLRHRRPVLEM
ncbi:MAG UNVERIFIED_CONTAM: serine/threonine protein kinase [Planctomycetaceae bacterium]|jgi:serine/threonine protein kinase